MTICDECHRLNSDHKVGCSRREGQRMTREPQAPQVTRDEVEALIQRVDDEENWSNIFPEEGRQIADALLAEFDITRKARS